LFSESDKLRTPAVAQLEKGAGKEEQEKIERILCPGRNQKGEDQEDNE
jgi:hypothetical protein